MVRSDQKGKEEPEKMLKRQWIFIVFALLLSLSSTTLAQEATITPVPLPETLQAMNGAEITIFRHTFGSVCNLAVYASGLTEKAFPMYLRLGRFVNQDGTEIGTYNDLAINEMPEDGMVSFSVGLSIDACDGTFQTKTMFFFQDGNSYIVQASEEDTVVGTGVLADLLLWQDGAEFKLYISPSRARTMPKGKYKLFVTYRPHDSKIAATVFIHEYDSLDDMLSFTAPLHVKDGDFEVFVILTETDEDGNLYQTAAELKGMQFSD